MDVKFINPFLQGTIEVLKTMAFIEPRPGKVYLKQTSVAYGDVSGVIGITGDVIGSLAISFTEKCILNIVNKILGESYSNAEQEVFDAVGEITNMISGVARNYLEKDKMSVYAAIPSVVYGMDHTINHILNSPSIVIPFMTESGPFVVDVCIKKTGADEKQQQRYHVINKKTPVVARAPAEPGIVLAPKEAKKPKISITASIPTEPGNTPDHREAEKPETLIAGPVLAESGNAPDPKEPEKMDKLTLMHKKLKELSEVRKTVAQQLEEQPFMEIKRRKMLQKKIPILDLHIKRLKLDITAYDMLSRISDEDLANPKITPHYQHYDNKKRKP
jgi:chemotaxis protein CheX